MVETKFIKGKWYKGLNNYYIKFDSLEKKSGWNRINFNESIRDGKYNNTPNYWGNNIYEEFALKNLIKTSEITKFLPLGHPDLEQNILQSLEIW